MPSIIYINLRNNNSNVNIHSSIYALNGPVFFIILY